MSVTFDSTIVKFDSTAVKFDSEDPRRYFIGTGNRNLVDPANWSLTSGGSPYQPASGVEKLPLPINFTIGWVAVSALVINANSFSSIVTGGIYLLNRVTSGKWCKFIISGTTTASALHVRNTVDGTINVNTNGTFSVLVYSLVTNTSIYLMNVGGGTTVISSFSIEEVDDIAPTSAINAIFDLNSGTGTLTINSAFVCKDFTASGISALTISGSVNTFSIYGSYFGHANLTWTLTGTSYLYFKATSLGKSITQNAGVMNCNRIYFDGVGGEWINQDDWNVGGASVYHTNGIWNTNGVTFTTINSYYIEVGVKTLTLGASMFYIVRWKNDNPTNFTFNYNTSTVIINTSISNNNISGVTTFYNLTLIGNAILTAGMALVNNVTVTNTLTLTGNNSTNYRLLVASNTIGTPRTITCNGTIVASNVDFRDITLAGTANRDLSAITGGSGDGGGNSGITFTPAQKQYYKHLGGGTTTFKDATKWFSDEALTIPGRMPLLQDDWDAVETSFNAPTIFQIDCPRIGRSCSLEGVANAVTMQLMNAIECYGSYVLGQNITPSGSFTVFLMGRGNFDLNLYGKIVYDLNINSFSGVLTNKNNFSLAGGVLTVTSGTLLLGSYTLYLRTLTQNGGALYLGSSEINLTRTGATQWNITGGLLYGENSIIITNQPSNVSNTLFGGGSKTYNELWVFANQDIYNFDITGNNTFAELKINPGRKVRFAAGTTQTINKLTAIGDAANPITIDSVTAAAHTLNLNGTVQNVDYVNFKYCNVVQQNKLFAGLNSVDSGNNVNIVFNAIAAPIAPVAFTEYEVVESTLLGKGLISANFTEGETMTTELLAKAFVEAVFTEGEEAAAELLAQAFITANFTESEIADFGEIVKGICISANFTEGEELALMVFEKITGQLTFSDVTIIGQMVFTERITGQLKFL